MSQLEYDHILISSDCLLEKVWKFLETRMPELPVTQADDDECVKLMIELQDCLEMLEILHADYQKQLRANPQQTQGIQGYAQSLSLNDANERGDITNVT